MDEPDRCIAPPTGCHPCEGRDPFIHLRCGELGPCFRRDDTEFGALAERQYGALWCPSMGGLGYWIASPPAVIPAKAGTQLSPGAGCEMGPSFRWDDTEFAERLVANNVKNPAHTL